MSIDQAVAVKLNLHGVKYFQLHLKINIFSPHIVYPALFIAQTPHTAHGGLK